jgi:tRNA A37 threonylcarbamoyladenosine biosynthesis protein TsaE
MVKGSGEWIFALPAFENWRKATTESPEGVKRGENCLWLQGNLGTGKTMLM